MSCTIQKCGNKYNLFSAQGSTFRLIVAFKDIDDLDGYTAWFRIARNINQSALIELNTENGGIIIEDDKFIILMTAEQTEEIGANSELFYQMKYTDLAGKVVSAIDGKIFFTREISENAGEAYVVVYDSDADGFPLNRLMISDDLGFDQSTTGFKVVSLASPFQFEKGKQYWWGLMVIGNPMPAFRSMTGTSLAPQLPYSSNVIPTNTNPFGLRFNPLKPSLADIPSSITRSDLSTTQTTSTNLPIILLRIKDES